MGSPAILKYLAAKRPERDYILGSLTGVDFLIGPRLDTGPAALNFDIGSYANINA
jgi:hypothetical protein